MNSFVAAFAVSLCALLPLAVAAQHNLLASQSARPAEFTMTLPEAPVSAENRTAASDRAAERRVLRVRGAWALSDGPLTVEVLDGLNRSVLRVLMPATDVESLGFPAPALAAGTYTVRVLDSRGAELHRQRVAYLTR